MTLFLFHQNNSGGKFKPPAQNVLIQAESVEIAVDLAKTKAGVYFEGVESGVDCRCCGDRWWLQPYPADQKVIDDLMALPSPKHWGPRIAILRSGSDSLEVTP